MIKEFLLVLIGVKEGSIGTNFDLIVLALSATGSFVDPIRSSCYLFVTLMDPVLSY